MNTIAAPEKTNAILVLNDNFRSTFVGGRILTTAGVAELPLDVKARLYLAVQSFNDFNADNDPHREHDFGEIELGGQTFFFKLDYYDAKDEQAGSEDPSDPEKTTRVLTIMRADEY